MNRLSKNDLVIKGTVIRKIIKVLDTGYLWCYPDIPNEVFNSNNSSDVEMVLGWEVL